MLKKNFPLIIFGFLLTAQIFSMGTTPMPDKSANSAIVYAKEMLIANFDSGSIKTDPAWWTFDRIQPVFKEAKNETNGLYYLEVTGKAESYYVGGMGTYVGKSLPGYDTLAMYVYGNGPASGIIKIQLYDDDKGNWQLDQDSKFEPLYDDRFEYELPVNWDGWRTVEIPLGKFVDTNHGVGDDVLNLERVNGVGGLLNFQFIFLATTATGNVNISLDNIKMVKKSE